MFKRDGFRCVYCGATPTDKPLHADHVISVKDGGETNASNLVTACPDCNGGKAAIPLAKKSLTPKHDLVHKDHADQILAYLAREREIDEAKRAVQQELADSWERIVGPLSQDLFDRFYLIGQDGWPVSGLLEAMQITARRMGSLGESYSWSKALAQTKYFYGILRRWREGIRASTPS